MIHNDNNSPSRILLFLVFTVVLFSNPTFEAPDELHHLLMLSELDKPNVYYYLANKFFNIFDQTSYYEYNNSLSYNSQFSFGSNSFYYSNDSRPIFFGLKLLSLMVFSLFLFFLRFINSYDRKLIYFSLCFPSFLYYIGLSSSDLLFTYFSVLIFIFLRRNWYFLVFLISLLGLVFEDNNFLTSVIFIPLFYLTYFHFKPNKKIWWVLYLISFYLMAFLIKRAILDFGIEPVAGHISYNQDFSGDLYRRLGAYVLSLWYLSGSMSFTAFGPEYFLIPCAIVVTLLYVKDRFYLAGVFSSLAVFIVISDTIYPINQARYYTFIFPFLYPAFCLMAKKIRIQVGLMQNIMLFMSLLYAMKLVFLYQML